ncbi:MAG: arsenite methyltransferase [Candidatus Latescibacterota bacterium]
MDMNEIKKELKKAYGSLTRDSGCCGSGSSCCGGPTVSEKLGYKESDLGTVPEGADLGLGCGNPTAFASLREGETVLDLGSGAGIDCFIAARAVGPAGRVIGVDMTPEMVEKARANTEKGGYVNVEFRLGEIENLPVEDGSVDAIISNCVINLSPEKDRVFAESFRVLKPGGRLMVSDIVLTAPLPERLKQSMTAYAACVSGAELKDRYLELMRRAGFESIAVIRETPFTADLIAFSESRGCCGDSGNDPGGIGETVRSITVSARKPV